MCVWPVWMHGLPTGLNECNYLLTWVHKQSVNDWGLRSVIQIGVPFLESLRLGFVFLMCLFFLFCALLLSQGGLKGEGCHGFLEKVNGRMSVLCEEDERCSCSLCVDDGKCQGQSQSVKPWPVFEFIDDVLQRDIGKGVRRGTMNYEGWKYLHEFCYIISNLSSWIFLVNKGLKAICHRY